MSNDKYKRQFSDYILFRTNFYKNQVRFRQLSPTLGEKKIGDSTVIVSIFNYKLFLKSSFLDHNLW